MQRVGANSPHAPDILFSAVNCEKQAWRDSLDTNEACRASYTESVQTECGTEIMFQNPVCFSFFNLSRPSSLFMRYNTSASPFSDEGANSKVSNESNGCYQCIQESRISAILKIMKEKSATEFKGIF